MIVRPLALPNQHNQFDEDAARYLIGELDPAGVMRLQDALLTDTSARTRFIHLASMHGNLCELGSRIAQGAVDSAKFLAVVRHIPPATAAVPARGRNWLIWGAVAAAALVMGVALTTLAQVHQRTRPMVPTIVAAKGGLHLVRDAIAIPLQVGTRLRPGDIVRTDTATASTTIELHGGRFTMTAGTEAIINISESGSRQITLLRGTIVAEMRTAESALCILANRNSVLIKDAATTIAMADDYTTIQIVRGQVDIRRADGTGTTLKEGKHILQTDSSNGRHPHTGNPS